MSHSRPSRYGLEPKCTAGKQAVASTKGNTLHGKERRASHLQTEVAINKTATAEHSSIGTPQQDIQVNAHFMLRGLPTLVVGYRYRYIAVGIGLCLWLRYSALCLWFILAIGTSRKIAGE